MALIKKEEINSLQIFAENWVGKCPPCPPTSAAPGKDIPIFTSDLLALSSGKTDLKWEYLSHKRSHIALTFTEKEVPT